MSTKGKKIEMLYFAYMKDMKDTRLVLLKQENPKPNFKMSAINQSLSLFIPRVFISINEDDIKRVFQSLRLGIVSHVDFIAKRGKNNFNYNAVYLHFREWFDNTAVFNFQENVLNPRKTAKLVYDDPWYWVVLENTASKTQELSASTWVPSSCLYKEAEDINWSARYQDYVANSLDFEDLILESKYARDVASKENEELRKENEELCEENEELHKAIDQLEQQSIELFYTQRDNQQLNCEVKNLKDELQASYIELGDMREEFYRQKRELEELRNLNEKK